MIFIFELSSISWLALIYLQARWSPYHNQSIRTQQEPVLYYLRPSFSLVKPNLICHKVSRHTNQFPSSRVWNTVFGFYSVNSLKGRSLLLFTQAIQNFAINCHLFSVRISQISQSRKWVRSDKTFFKSSILSRAFSKFERKLRKLLQAYNRWAYFPSNTSIFSLAFNSWRKKGWWHPPLHRAAAISSL